MQVPSISQWEASFCLRLRKLKLAPAIKKEANKMITKQRRESPIGRLVVLGSIPFNLKHNFFSTFLPHLTQSGLRISNRDAINKDSATRHGICQVAQVKLEF